jgi:hypothetical protein
VAATERAAAERLDRADRGCRPLSPQAHGIQGRVRGRTTRH